MREVTMPIVRSHERMDYKRCKKKHYWKWRRGLTLKLPRVGALDLGTWVHDALAAWYGLTHSQRKRASLVDIFRSTYGGYASSIPESQREKAEELSLLGEAMMEAYEVEYADEDIEPIGAEIPLEFSFSDDSGRVIAIHRLKPDLVYRTAAGKLWLLETKTAASILSTEHLELDDQARPYLAMSEMALRNAGLIRPGERLEGIMYNYLRKAFPDERERDAEGRYLNKNGTVSARQPPPYFKRVPVRMTNAAKAVTLHRIRQESAQITREREELILKGTVNGLNPKWIQITPHKSCARFCDYFEMCKLQEQGADIRDLKRSMFKAVNPYDYDKETTEEIATFEMG